MLRAVARARRYPAADHQRQGIGAAEHVAHLGRLIEQLVGGNQDKVGVHDFHHRAHSIQGSTDAKTGKPVFADRRRDQAIWKQFGDTLGGAGGAAA